MAIKNTVVSCRLHGALLDAFEHFAERNRFESRSDAFRALIARGLYIEEKPRGNFKESAWTAAYNNYLMRIHSSVERSLLRSEGGVDSLILRGIEETAARLGFDTID